MSDDIERYVIESRRICWPNPDATCLHGGCGYCEYGVWKTLTQLERYARGAGVLPHRGRGEEDALHALRYGLERDFFDRPGVRTSRERLEEWCERLGAQALKTMAEGMPRVREAKRAEVLAWMLRYRRDMLEESYRTSAHALRVVTR